MSILQIFEDLKFDDEIIKHELHSYSPRNSNFNKNDEIRIEIQHQDLFTYPAESYLYIQGSIEIAAADNAAAFLISNNPYAFLFEEIRYEINGQTIDCCKNTGMASTIKGYVSYNEKQSKNLELAGWWPNEKPKINFLADKKFIACLPLSHLMGFFEDYKKIILFAKQELILFRSRSDVNCYSGIENCDFKIDRIEWRIPHISVKQQTYLELLNIVNQDAPILIPFRKWEIHELPALRTTTKDIWSVKTSTSLERPRYVVVAFQENRKDTHEKDITKFDHCNIRNVKIFLNAEAYPYDNLGLRMISNDYTSAYLMYSKFQESYYKKINEPLFNYNDYKNCMLYVFDVSHQDESLMSSTVDLKIEIEADDAFKPNTRALALILSDAVYEYKPLSSQIKKII